MAGLVSKNEDVIKKNKVNKREDGIYFSKELKVPILKLFFFTENLI